MDSLLVTLLVVVIAALSNWLQRRAQGHDNQENTGRPKPSPPTPRPRRTATPPVAPSPTLESTLERELRRLLGEEPPVPPSPPPGRTAQSPVVQPPPVIAQAPAPAARRYTPPEPMTPRPEVVPTATAAQLGQAGSAYEQAQHLHESVALRLRQVDERTEKHGPGRMHPVAPVPLPSRDLSLAVLSRNPQAVRQAFIASLIFGEPKGL